MPNGPDVRFNAGVIYVAGQLRDQSDVELLIALLRALLPFITDDAT